MESKETSIERDDFSEKTELNRSLGLPEALSIVFGRIIGSGIFGTPGIIMATVGGSVGLFFSSWLVGAIATLLGAFCYAELVSMMPRSGGPYAYLKIAYSPLWSFLRGWAMFFVSETASIVGVALIFAHYAGVLCEHFFGITFAVPERFLTAFSVIWLLSLVNCFGVWFNGMIMNIFSSLKLLSLLAIIYFGFSATGDANNFTQTWGTDLSWLAAIQVVGYSLQYSFFAYSGWEGATYVAEEVKNPRRNLPLSIILGVVGVMLVYFAVNAAYLYQMPVPDFIAAKREIASSAMKNAVGALGAIFIAGAVMFSTFGNVAAQILAKARTWYSMARDGLFPSFLGKVHPVYKTPNAALLTQAAWATVILLFVIFSKNAYKATINFFSFTSAIFNISTFLAVWIMRVKYPDLERPFRLRAMPLVLGLVVLIQVAFMGTIFVESWVAVQKQEWLNAVSPLLGVALTATGLIYYKYFVDKDAKI